MNQDYKDHPLGARIQSIFFQVKKAGGVKTWANPNPVFQKNAEMHSLMRDAGYSVELEEFGITINSPEFIAKEIIKAKMKRIAND